MRYNNWCITFRDETEELYREELYDEKENYENLGDILVFNKKFEADKFIDDNCDSSAYDFYSKIYTDEEIEFYCERYKCDLITTEELRDKEAEKIRAKEDLKEVKNA